MSQGSSGRAAPTAHLATHSTKTYIGNITKDYASAHYGDVITNYFSGPSEPTPEQCLGDLRVTDPREDRARIEGGKDVLLRDCYVWVLDNDSFKRWRTQDEAQLLWIMGDPGKGKTMMMMGVIDELSQPRPPHKAISETLMLTDNPTPLLSFFFCQNTVPALNNAVSVLRGLIYMLVKQRDGLLRYVYEEYKTAGKQLFNGHNAIYSLRSILLSILNDASLPPTCLLIDALDECTSGLPELLGIITDASLRQQSRVKWLVTSRNIPEIKRRLQPDVTGIKVSLEISASYVSKAVAAFIEYKVRQFTHDYKTQQEVQQMLYNKAEGTFLWVSLACKELEGVPPGLMGEVLQELPRGLGPLYERMMTHIKEQNPKIVGYCEEILRTITLAFRPLQLEELAATTGLLKDWSSDIQTVANLVSYCGSFLTVREDTISFIHLSAKDFFTTGSGRQVFSGPLEEEHGQMTIRLLDAMNSKIKKDICGLQKPGVRIQEATGRVRRSCLPQIAYACEYWVEHLQAGGHACSDILADGGKVHSFFQKHLLHWLEAISLLQKMLEAILALQKLEAILDGAESTTVLNVVHDALRFAMWSGSGIQEAPLQVYYGALVFAPERSIIRRCFQQEMPKRVQVKCGLEEDWGPLLQTLEGHTSGVNNVAFSAVGDRLASASYDNTVRVWDAKTGQLLHTLEGHTSGVNSVAFSAAGDRLASASDDKTVRVWDAKTGQPLHTLEGYSGWASEMAFSPDGKILASIRQHKTVELWDVETGEMLEKVEYPSDRARAVIFSSDRTALALVSDHQTASPLIEHTSALVTTVKSYGSNTMALSSGGKILASVSNDDSLTLWDADTDTTTKMLKGHSGKISAVAFSADGNMLASVSSDKTIKLWDTGTGAMRWTLQLLSSDTIEVTFSPDGKVLASASDDKTIKLWDVGTGALTQTLADHSDSVWAVAFSPDGKWLASASRDKTVKLWQVDTGAVVYTLTGHSDIVSAVAFSPDGKVLVSASHDRTVKLWVVSTGAFMQTLEDRSDSVWAVAFSPDGKVLVSVSHDWTVKLWDVGIDMVAQTPRDSLGDVQAMTFLPDSKVLALLNPYDGKVKLLDTATGVVMKTTTIDPDWYSVMALSPIGKTLALVSSRETVKLWDVTTGEESYKLEGHPGGVMQLTFSPDGKALASVSLEETVKLWNISTGDLEQTIEGFSHHSDALAFSPDNKALGSTSYKTVKLWKDGMGAALHTLEGHLDSVRAVAFSPDGKVLASASDDKTVKLWDVGIDMVAQTPRDSLGEVQAMTFSPDGKVLASISGDRMSNDKMIKLWDVRKGSVWKTFESRSGPVDAVAFSPDGKILASISFNWMSNDNTIDLWEVATGNILQRLKKHSDLVWAVAFSPDSKLLASASRDKTVKLWQVDTGAVGHTLTGHSDIVSAIAFSPDGKVLVSASHDKTVKIWEVSTGVLLKTLNGHESFIRAVAFSPDGKVLASISYDKVPTTQVPHGKMSYNEVVKLWDSGTGRLLQTFKGHSDKPSATAFSPNGEVLALASGDGTVRLWDANISAAGAELEAHPVDATLSTLLFSDDAAFLRIHRGPIHTGFSFTASSPWQTTSPKVFIREQWMEHQGSKELWLPPEYRATCVAVYDEVVALGHNFGLVSLLRLLPNTV